MTKIIRINACDECPHNHLNKQCRATTRLNERGIIYAKDFYRFPIIPDWCPLEEEEIEDQP